MQTEILSIHETSRAAMLLKAGELVAFPTETVYGLGAHLFLQEALVKVFQAKGRPSDNPLIVHLSDVAQVSEIAVDIPDEFYQLAHGFFPGPLTVILKRHLRVPLIACAGLESVAVRFPSHKVAKELIEKVGAPLVAPSANLSGKPSATELSHVIHDFEGKIAGIIDGGPTSLGIESTVISLLDPKRPLLLRPGSITRGEIESVLQKEVGVSSETQEAPISPGMKYRHYAPNAPIKLFSKLDDLHLYLADSSPKKRLFLASKKEEGISADYYPLSSQMLYAHLRLADSKGYQEILVFCDEIIQNDTALMNRLKKAAS